MKTILLLFGLLVVASDVLAQKVTVTGRTARVLNETADGFGSDLDAGADDVRTALGKFMKESGKTKNNGDMFTVSEPVINGTVYNKGALYATVNGSDVKTRVWIGIIKGQWSAEEAEAILKEVEQMTYRFGIKYYRDKIQLQINETQQAADAVTKQAQRTQNEGESLQRRLKANDEEKIRLEKSLEANKLEDLVLKQKIVNNKKSLDSLAAAGVKIQSVMDAQKERQGKVN